MERVDGCLRREVEIEGHFALSGGGIVGELQELAAKGGDCCFGLY